MTIAPTATARPSGLFVVAFPKMAEADLALLTDLRARHHLSEAWLIGPHITFVFQQPPEREEALAAALSQISETTPAVDMVLRRTSLHVEPGAAYAFVEPQEGREQALALYRALNAAAGTSEIAGKPAYSPHITIGKSQSAQEMRDVLQKLRRADFSMPARIDTLSLIDISLGRMQVLGEANLT
jgi:2'-5' RNA ligase